MRITRSTVTVAMSLALLAMLWPATAHAQRGRGRRAVRVAPVRAPIVRSVVLVRGGFGYSFYDPYWGPYWSGYGPYGYGPARDALGSVRLQVTPQEAEVFVDGYYTGRVDDFDGIFQRLRLLPGGHEIVIYGDGYRSLRERIYVAPGTTHKIQEAMAPLGPGEPAEQPPVPLPSEPRAGDASPLAPGWDVVESDRARPESGTLAIRVQPSDADVLIDGERWRSTTTNDPLMVQVSPGAHRIEIRKDGYRTYSEDVNVSGGTAVTLNVSLSLLD